MSAFRLRILLSIHHKLDPDAGAPGATLRLAEALRSLGHRVDVVSFDDMKGPEETKRYRFPWFVAAEIARRPSYDVYDLSSGDGWVASLRRTVRRRRDLSIIVARSHGLEHSMHNSLLAETKAHGGSLSWKYPIYHGGYRLWECRQSFARADLALFLNQHDRDYAVHKLGVDPASTARVVNGVAESFIRHACGLASRPQVSAQPPTNVAFIGSHIERKGTRLLRDSMIRLMRRNLGVRLGLFGTGVPAKAILDTYPEDLRGRISVVAGYHNSELPDLLADFHILAFPSLSEGFPLAPVEAMACGLVPVVSDIPGATDIVRHERNGLVAARASGTAFEQSIERLLHEPDTRSRLRLAAIHSARRYSWREIAMSAVSLYDGCRTRTDPAAPGARS